MIVKGAHIQCLLLLFYNDMIKFYLVNTKNVFECTIVISHWDTHL